MSNDNSLPKTYTADEAAEILKKSRASILRMCREKHLKAYKIGGRWLIDKSSVRALFFNADDL